MRAEKAGNAQLVKRLRGYIDEDEANSETSENLESEQASDTERTEGQKENASEGAVQYERKAEIDYNNAKINFDVIDLVSKVKRKQHKDNDDVELISPSREVLEELKNHRYRFFWI